MKSNILKLSSLILLGISSPVFAALGTINFNGAVNSTTCSGVVSGGSSGSSSETIILPTVTKDKLDSAAKVEGKTQFTINLTDGNGGKCSITDTSTKYAVPYFVYEAGRVNSDGRLKNLATVGAATNVDIELLTNAATANKIDIVDDIAQNTSTASDNESYVYYAQYYATGTSTEGEVKATVTYNIIYK